MRFSSGISTKTSLDEACAEAVEQAVAGLDAPPDLCVVFASTRFPDKERVPALLGDLAGARHLIGCSGEGIIGGGAEFEGRPAVSVTLASLPGVEVRCQHLEDGDLPDDDGPPGAWVDMMGVNVESAAGFVVLPDPFTFQVHRLLAGLDFAYPAAPKVGGLASGSQHPGGHALFCGRQCYPSGAVVLSLAGDVVVDTRVAQGCKPFGAVGKITKAENHYLLGIDGVPALKFLQDQLGKLEGRDLELASKTPLFLGIGMDPFATETPAAGDFLIRNVMEYDSKSGSLTIGEILSVGRSVQFHLRDRTTSAQDLRDVLSSDRPHRGGPAGPARGALVFSCLGRGRHLYGEEGHDSKVFAEVMGPLALGGFFCNGEIGPVQGTTYLHGYTSSFAVFAETTP